MKYLVALVACVVLFSATSDVSAQCHRPLRKFVHRVTHRVVHQTRHTVHAGVCATHNVVATAREVVDVATPRLELRSAYGNCSNGVCTPVQ